MGKFIDLTGMRFGRLTVTSRAENTLNTSAKWHCKCDCGGETIVYTSSLNSGNIKSCKCLLLERQTHGAYIKTKSTGTRTKEQKTWHSMVSRSKHSKMKSQQHLTVCDRWLNSFEDFLADMGEAPTDEHQIDRIKNKLGYSPDNCRWLTPQENQRNKTTNRIVEWNGKSHCIAEWAEILEPRIGCSAHNLITRLDANWAVEKAFTTPIFTARTRPTAKMIEWRGQTKSLAEWAEDLCPVLGISYDTMQQRVSKLGWDTEAAFTTPKLRTRSK